MKLIFTVAPGLKLSSETTFRKVANAYQYGQNAPGIASPAVEFAGIVIPQVPHLPASTALTMPRFADCTSHMDCVALALGLLPTVVGLIGATPLGIALCQARTGIDPEANGRDLVGAVEE